MKVTVLERRWCDALMHATVDPTGAPWPGGDAFWTLFEQRAPLHLMLALRAATVLIAGVLPRLSGHLSAFDQLDADAQERLVQRAAQLPLFSDLSEIVKIVACFAYFEDDAVQRRFRGGVR